MMVILGKVPSSAHSLLGLCFLRLMNLHRPAPLAVELTVIFAIYAAKTFISRLNDFQFAKSKLNRGIQVRILCAGSSGCGD
jgi:hypothetical protein